MNSKISFTTMATPGLDIPAQISVAKQYGFHGVDFRVGALGKGEISLDLTTAQAEEIKVLLSEIQLPSLLCYNKNIHAGWHAMVESVIDCIRLAALLDCPMVRIFTGKVRDEVDMEKLVCAFRDIFVRDQHPIKLGMQIHKNNGVTLAQALEVCSRVDNDRLGIILSPEQSIQNGENDMLLLEKAAPYVLQVYVADIDDTGGFALIGEGIVDYRAILGCLYSHGFDGFVTLKWEKCWAPQLPEYPIAFHSFLEMLRRYGFLKE